MVAELDCSLQRRHTVKARREKLFAKKQKVGRTICRLSNAAYYSRDNESLTFQQLVKDCRITGVNRRITGKSQVRKTKDSPWQEVKNFPEIDVVTDSKHTEYLFIGFRHRLSWTQIFVVLEKLALEPANVRELLCVLSFLPKKELKRILHFDLVAPGSCWKQKVNRVPYVDCRKRLRLSHGTDFSKRDVFLTKRQV